MQLNNRQEILKAKLTEIESGIDRIATKISAMQTEALQEIEDQISQVEEAISRKTFTSQLLEKEVHNLREMRKNLKEKLQAFLSGEQTSQANAPAEEGEQLNNFQP